MIECLVHLIISGGGFDRMPTYPPLSHEALKKPKHRVRNVPASPLSKREFDVSEVLSRIRTAIAKFPKAMLFDLASRGYASPFEQIVACMISIRTLDEVSGPVALRLFEAARTPQEMAKLSEAEIFRRIEPSRFARTKAKNILSIARSIIEERNGQTPSDFDGLTALPGIGPKCANLVLGVACHKPAIAVDVHVHRVTNRWGFVAASTPEKTLAALEEKLPRRHWVEINSLLVPFGKHICTSSRPKCSTCPVLEFCRQVGVTSHR